MMPGLNKKDQELMTNSSKQSSLIISITRVNACNHGSNCSSEEGLFSQASLSVTKKTKSANICIDFLMKIYLCFERENHAAPAVKMFMRVCFLMRQR